MLKIKYTGPTLCLGIFNGYLCFVVSISYIGVCTAVIGDVAAQLGCFICLKDSVNAIAFVALGTSVPGTQNSSSSTRQKQSRQHWTWISLGLTVAASAHNITLNAFVDNIELSVDT